MNVDSLLTFVSQLVSRDRQLDIHNWRLGVSLGRRHRAFNVPFCSPKERFEVTRISPCCRATCHKYQNLVAWVSLKNRRQLLLLLLAEPPFVILGFWIGRKRIRSVGIRCHIDAAAWEIQKKGFRV